MGNTPSSSVGVHRGIRPTAGTSGPKKSHSTTKERMGGMKRDMYGAAGVREKPVHQKVSSLDFSGPRPPAPPPLIPDTSAVYDLMDVDEDVCPTCLEEYSDENPKIATVCGHPYHLSCILEWMNRNPHCPICGVKMKFEEGSGLTC